MSAAMPNSIVVYGVGGHGRETALLVESMIEAGAPWRLIGFLDDDVQRHGERIGALPILGGAEYLATRRGQVAVAVGVGNPRSRSVLVERLRPFVHSFPVLVHPDIPRFDRVVVGEGAQIHAGTVLTVDIALASFVILNRHVDISHDCRLDAFATLAPAVSLAGAVHIGAGAELGIRASCIPGVHVGNWSVIGAGAVVTRDIPDGVTAVGVPARALTMVS